MVRMPFLFVAGAVPLDFLNTEVMSGGAPADLLESSDDLLSWLSESGLATPAELRAMRPAPVSLRQTWWKDALRLRASLRALFSRVADGQDLRETDLRPINDVLSHAPGQLRLERREEQLSLGFKPGKAAPLFLLASAAARFLAGADLRLVRRCEGEGCILFFYDVTKSHTRRWCSMSTCGNRTKVKAHYVRKRGDT